MLAGAPGRPRPIVQVRPRPGVGRPYGIHKRLLDAAELRCGLPHLIDGPAEPVPDELAGVIDLGCIARCGRLPPPASRPKILDFFDGSPEVELHDLLHLLRAPEGRLRRLAQRTKRAPPCVEEPFVEGGFGDGAPVHFVRIPPGIDRRLVRFRPRVDGKRTRLQGQRRLQSLHLLVDSLPHCAADGETVERVEKLILDGILPVGGQCPEPLEKALRAVGAGLLEGSLRPVGKGRQGACCALVDRLDRRDSGRQDSVDERCLRGAHRPAERPEGGKKGDPLRRLPVPGRPRVRLLPALFLPFPDAPRGRGRTRGAQERTAAGEVVPQLGVCGAGVFGQLPFEIVDAELQAPREEVVQPLRLGLHRIEDALGRDVRSAVDPHRRVRAAVPRHRRRPADARTVLVMEIRGIEKTLRLQNGMRPRGRGAFEFGHPRRDPLLDAVQ